VTSRYRKFEDAAFRQIGRAEKLLLHIPGEVVLTPSRTNRLIFRVLLALLLVVALLGFLPETIRVKLLLGLLGLCFVATMAVLIFEGLSTRR
jgi:hypothetical protein